MLDVDFGDLIDFLSEDPHTTSVILYMESVGNARKFMSAARNFARSKPIVVMKPGKYAEAAMAAISHTGTLAGSYEVYEAAFKRAGAVQVHYVEDLFSCARLLNSRRLPTGPRIAIITNAGGPGVIAADVVKDYGGELSQMAPSTMEQLSSALPTQWSHGNPIDLLGDADVERYAAALRPCLADPAVDGVVIIYTPQGAASPTELADLISKWAMETSKPIIGVLMGAQEVAEARKILEMRDIPSFSSPEDGIRAYMYMYNYRRNQTLLYQTPQEFPINISPPLAHLKILVKRALQDGRLVLTQEDADKFLDAYGIPRPKGGIFTDLDEASAAAASFGYPIVLKIVSPDIPHKTDIGGVVKGIASEAELRDAFQRLIARVRSKSAKSRIEGVYVQRMIQGVDYELILGSKKDVDFGSVILFGSGGLAVEVFRDFAIGLPPMNQVLATMMMERTCIYKALKTGLRDKPPADMALLEEVIVKFSNLIVDFPEIAEVDINPLAVSASGVFALDTRIILDPKDPGDGDAYRHLVIMPYPTRYVTPYRLKDGTEVLLRPIRPEDEPLEEELIKGLSEETRLLRFFEPLRNVTHEMLVMYCNVDYDRQIAIVAEYSQAGKKRNVGVAELIIEPGEGRAELAVVVAEDFQRKGLGTKLFDLLIGIAKDKGLQSVYAVMLPRNKRMISLCKKFGFTIKYGPDEVVAELPLRP